MFPRNPENEARRLPQPARRAAPPRGPTDAELPGKVTLLFVHINTFYEWYFFFFSSALPGCLQLSLYSREQNIFPNINQLPVNTD